MADGSTYDFTPQVTTSRDLAASAANLLEARGWCQGWLKKTTGEMCLIGALEEATRLAQVNFATYREASMAVQERINKSNLNVAQWNDHVGRTKEEVVGLLREVAGG